VTTTVDPPARADVAIKERRTTDIGSLILRYALPAAVTVVGVGVLLRFFTTSALWLDEALSVNIAKLPIRQIPGALRHDGAPPLYYMLLHFWMRGFGRTDFAVRALSGLTSVAALPFAYMAGKRLAGRAGAWASLVLLASSPFAINYATATRMYSLMILLCLVGFLALARALESPTTRRLTAVAILTAATAYTHYWGLYFIAVTAGWLLYQARRARPTVQATGGMAEVEKIRRPYWLCFCAMCIAGAAFLPWLPTFVFQSLHTGTPWSNGAAPGDILGVLGEYTGSGPWGAALALTLFTLLLLGLFGRSIDGTQVLVQLRTRHRIRPIALVFFGTLVVAVGCGAIAQAAFVGRYTAIVFPLFILIVAVGATVFADRRVMAVVLAWASLCGIVVAIGGSTNQRTEATQVASVINEHAIPGDLVVYCPDQLAPAASRLIHVPVVQATFPREIGPLRINWVDYRTVISETSVQQFAVDVMDRAAGHDIWFVWQANYAGTQGKCSQLFTWLQDLRSNGQELVRNDPGNYFEHEALVRFPL
jgi:uncharacterized membrane protein